MPQLTLEFSANILEKKSLTALLKNCHEIIAENLPTSIESCKSRAHECEIYCVGDGQPHNAFVHVNLKVLPGRSVEQKTLVANKVMDKLKEYFADSLNQFKLQITLEIEDLQTTYFKFAS